MKSCPKQQRRYMREQVLEEGTLTIPGSAPLPVDVLDVSFDEEQGGVRGFGLLVPVLLSPKTECLLRLPVSKYAGEYLGETVYSQDIGFGYRSGIFVQRKVK